MQKIDNTIFQCHVGFCGDINAQHKVIVYNITGHTINIPLIKSLRATMWRYAMFEVLTGSKQGQTRQITSHDSLSITHNGNPLGTPPKEGIKIRLYWDLQQIPLAVLNNTIIEGVSFVQRYDVADIVPKAGGKSIFPLGMVGVEFRRCNLTNVKIHTGNSAISHKGISSCNDIIKKCNDMENWKMSWDGTKWVPQEPVAVKLFNRLGLSVNPVDIPATKQDTAATHTKEKENQAIRDANVKAAMGA